MIGVLDDMAAPFSRWRTWWLMGSQDIQLRYRRSLIGPFWISLSMAAMIGGLGLLYSRIFGADQHEYLFYLACGFLPWFFISQMLMDGCIILTEAEPHVRGLRLPIPIFAARIVYRNIVVMLHNLIVVGALMALLGYKPQLTLLMLPLGFALLSAIGYFSALILGPFCLRFRDVTQVMASLIQLTFFITPILWQPSTGRVPAIVTEVNPFHHMVELIRAPMLGQWPTEMNWIVSVSLALGLGLISLALLTTTRRRVFLWL